MLGGTELISPHHLGDLIYWFIFFLGECLWVFSCAAAAIRSKSNPLKTRRQYVALNWDIYLIRFACEFGIYFAWRHVALNTILSYFHLPYQFSPDQGGPGAGGPVAAFFLGLGADVIFNTLSHWQKLPDQLRMFIQEKIPDVPQDQSPTPAAPGAK